MSMLFHLYAGLYDGFMRRRGLDDFRPIVNILETRRPPLAICDVGGGTGELAGALVRLGHRVTILDPCEKMTAIARKKSSDIAVVGQALEAWNGAPAFDIVILRDALHHMENQDVALRKIHGMLKDGGLLMVQEFFPDSKEAKRLFLLERCCFERVWPLPPEKLLDMAETAGFTGGIRRINCRDYLMTGVKHGRAFTV